MKKLVINEFLERNLESYKIIMIEETYNKTASGKSWSKKGVTITEGEITSKQYANILNATSFFRSLGSSERIEKGYTIAGFIPTRLSSINPSKDIKIIRRFKIESK